MIGFFLLKQEMKKLTSLFNLFNFLSPSIASGFVNLYVSFRWVYVILKAKCKSHIYN